VHLPPAQVPSVLLHVAPSATQTAPLQQPDLQPPPAQQDWPSAPQPTHEDPWQIVSGLRQTVAVVVVEVLGQQVVPSSPQGVQVPPLHRRFGAVQDEPPVLVQHRSPMPPHRSVLTQEPSVQVPGIAPHAAVEATQRLTTQHPPLSQRLPVQQG
jgi:hypothetical protein